MKNIRDILDFKDENVRRLGLLLVSTLIIIIASALAYARLVYEEALKVDNTVGITEGSGSTASAGMSLALATTLILTVPALVTSLTILSFRHKLSTRISNPPGRSESSPSGPVTMPSQREEWEESPSKDHSDA
jgi:hypothetical protein